MMDLKIVNLIGKLPKSSQKWPKRSAGSIKIVAIHHEGSVVRPDNYDEIAALKSVADYHIQKNWGTISSPAHAPTIAYHFAIGRSGQIYILNEITDVTWHARNANSISIGVLLQGNFEKQKPSLNQLISLNSLLKLLCNGFNGMKVNPSDIYGHCELKGSIMSLKYARLTDFGNYTNCPASALQYVQEFRATGSIKNYPKSNDNLADHVGTFSDLEPTAWYYAFANTLAEAGVMRGYDDKTWRPAEHVTRAELAKVIVGAVMKADVIKNIYKEFYE